ncbi:RN145 protein, partial [Geococcyx californianus]|nr:RN145 protein [Geococcyx californianus]
LAPRWQPWALLAPLMPVLGHLVGVPPQALPLLGAFAASLSVLGGLCLLGPHIRAPFQLAAAAGRELREIMQAPQRLVAHVLSLWSSRAVPLLFLVFWLGLFGLRLAAFVTSGTQHSLLLLLLSSAAECCSTPYSLIGLTFTVSYLALGVLNLCKFYLMGFGAFQNGNVMHRSAC